MRRPGEPGGDELKDQVRCALWEVSRADGKRAYEEFVLGFREDLALTADEISHRSTHFYAMLDEIDMDEHQCGRHLLTAVLVQAGQYGKPGPGFFHCARRLGFEIDDERRFWKAELKAVHDEAPGKPCPPAG